jgi:hypothetical protein
MLCTAEPHCLKLGEQILELHSPGREQVSPSVFLARHWRLASQKAPEEQETSRPLHPVP